ncbi:hypothetical protein D3C87_1994120 [compost metagenome]
MRRIHARDQAHTCRGTHGHRVGVCKLNALTGEPFHIRRVVTAVEIGRFGPERDRRILPAHIVDQENNDIGFAC